MTRLAVIAALCASPAWAYDDSEWYTSSRSMSRIIEAQGDCAEIHIFNRPTDNIVEMRGELMLGNLVVGIAYRMNVNEGGAERYTIFPPDGYTANPSELTVLDDEDGLSLVCPWIGG